MPVVSVSERPDDPGRVLFDVASLGAPAPVLHNVAPSPDGTRVLVVVLLGDDAHTLAVRVIETASGRVDHRYEAQGYIWSPVWLPGNTGFIYGGLAEPQADLPPAPGMRLIHQHLDAALTREIVPLEHGQPRVAELQGQLQRLGHQHQQLPVERADDGDEDKHGQR
ncbi:hypothetical protein [Pelomonas sp. KK5]|uniref:hypothetical protein n=1 Tax=Pelomonas sp. KK5 TaxID=1855730 RepID=UPI00097C7937|nr:hypothetical protein [Pelomonas sp. KK5]